MEKKHLYFVIDPQKLRFQMMKNYMGYKELCEATGLSTTTIQNLLKGTHTPRPKNLKKLCEALKCSQFDILKDNENEGA